MTWNLSILVLLLSLVVPSSVLGQEATPRYEERTALPTMLSSVPAAIPGLEDPSRAIVVYSDIAAQLDAIGAAVPDSVDDVAFERWSEATRDLLLPPPALSYLFGWREDYGFDLLQADQTIWVEGEYELALYRGRFDERAVLQRLRAVGYALGEHGVLSLRADHEIDLYATTSYRGSAMNHAAILPDGTLVFGSVRGAVEAVLAVAAGDRESLAARSDVAALLEHAPDDLVSAVIVDGEALGGTQTALSVGSVTPSTPAPPHQPPVSAAIVGTTAGGPVADASAQAGTGLPEARAVILLFMASPAAAADAAPVIAARLVTEASTRTEVPYATYFPEREVRHVTGAPIVMIDLTLGVKARRGLVERMLMADDLGFLAP